MFTRAEYPYMGFVYGYCDGNGRGEVAEYSRRWIGKGGPVPWPGRVYSGRRSDILYQLLQVITDATNELRNELAGMQWHMQALSIFPYPPCACEARCLKGITGNRVEDGEPRSAAPATGALRRGETLNHRHWLPLVYREPSYVSLAPCVGACHFATRNCKSFITENPSEAGRQSCRCVAGRSDSADQIVASRCQVAYTRHDWVSRVTDEPPRSTDVCRKKATRTDATASCGAVYGLKRQVFEPLELLAATQSVVCEHRESKELSPGKDTWPASKGKRHVRHRTLKSSLLVNLFAIDRWSYVHASLREHYIMPVQRPARSGDGALVVRASVALIAPALLGKKKKKMQAGRILKEPTTGKQEKKNFLFHVLCPSLPHTPSNSLFTRSPDYSSGACSLKLLFRRRLVKFACRIILLSPRFFLSAYGGPLDLAYLSPLSGGADHRVTWVFPPASLIGRLGKDFQNLEKRESCSQAAVSQPKSKEQYEKKLLMFLRRWSSGSHRPLCHSPASIGPPAFAPYHYPPQHSPAGISPLAFAPCHYPHQHSPAGIGPPAFASCHYPLSIHPPALVPQHSPPVTTHTSIHPPTLVPQHSPPVITHTSIHPPTLVPQHSPPVITHTSIHPPALAPSIRPLSLPTIAFTRRHWSSSIRPLSLPTQHSPAGISPPAFAPCHYPHQHSPAGISPPAFAPCHYPHQHSPAGISPPAFAPCHYPHQHSPAGIGPLAFSPYHYPPQHSPACIRPPAFAPCHYPHQHSPAGIGPPAFAPYHYPPLHSPASNDVPAFAKPRKTGNRPMAMLILHKAEEFTTCIQVDLEQGFEKCSFYREQPIVYFLQPVDNCCVAQSQRHQPFIKERCSNFHKPHCPPERLLRHWVVQWRVVNCCKFTLPLVKRSSAVPPRLHGSYWLLLRAPRMCSTAVSKHQLTLQHFTTRHRTPLLLACEWSGMHSVSPRLHGGYWLLLLAPRMCSTAVSKHQLTLQHFTTRHRTPLLLACEWSEYTQFPPGCTVVTGSCCVHRECTGQHGRDTLSFSRLHGGYWLLLRAPRMCSTAVSKHQLTLQHFTTRHRTPLLLACEWSGMHSVSPRLHGGYWLLLRAPRMYRTAVSKHQLTLQHSTTRHRTPLLLACEWSGYTQFLQAARWLLAPAACTENVQYSSEQAPAYLATLHHTPQDTLAARL
ncbi:hypothetical protein PR048_007187 [Dryococelus australis]|uniref:Uncharacterized protein n=1 Tax=Dryococelus australis TaxID=614101 RepID=A0ABQ9ICX3_9NEOP|nr:hypothetical protein PR048_007187 [Dryococelus australis]